VHHLADQATSDDSDTYTIHGFSFLQVVDKIGPTVGFSPRLGAVTK